MQGLSEVSNRFGMLISLASEGLQKWHYHHWIAKHFKILLEIARF